MAEGTVDLPDAAKRPEPGSPPAEAPCERAGFVTRLLWSSAGADGDLLERCPHSDSVKYQSMGGIVLATAVLAFASGSYAFYTVFEPKTGTALGREMHVPTMLLSVIAGLVWGLVIFNLDRFIVSSTGRATAPSASRSPSSSAIARARPPGPRR